MSRVQSVLHRSGAGAEGGRPRRKPGIRQASGGWARVRDPEGVVVRWNGASERSEFGAAGGGNWRGAGKRSTVGDARQHGVVAGAPLSAIHGPPDGESALTIERVMHNLGLARQREAGGSIVAQVAAADGAGDFELATRDVRGDAQEAAFAAAIASMRVRREAGIDALVAHARAEGSAMIDRMYWTIVYDLERAPTTSNRAQLRVLGIEVPPATLVEDEALPSLIAEIASGLARWGVYLQCTDHLTDRELYDRLESRVLDEQVAELPPDSGASEHIDFAVDASSEVLDWYARRERDSPARSGCANRDRFLPTPHGGPVANASTSPAAQHDLE